MAADIWPTVHAERDALIGDLEGLKPEQWSAATMCGHWNVHQVCGHLTSLAKMTPPKFFGQMLSSGFNFGKYAEKGVAQETADGPEATIAALKAAKDKTSAPPGPKETWLGEHFVHGEDIRRALGIKHAYPADAVVTVADFYKGSNLLIGSKNRIAGLTLRATDADWSHGTGPR